MADYLIQLADKAKPSFRKAVLDAFTAASSATRRGQGMNERTLMSVWAEEAVPRIDAAMKDMQQSIIIGAGKKTLDQVKAGESWRFDAVNPRAVAYVQAHTAELIVDITRTQREAIRQAIGRVIGAEISATTAEKHIRSVIGLTPRMESAAWSFRARTMAQGIPVRRADRLFESYRTKLVKARAETIARTETIQALSAGRVEAWQQAIDAGVLPAGSEKKWIVTGDDRLCPVCRAMTGERADMEGGTFSGGVLFPPRHPRCRCAVTIVRAKITPLRVTRTERVPVLR